MEDYYVKYAKPLEELTIEELRSKLSEWQNWTKEELELIIFISNGVKNESMNKLSQSSKLKTLAQLDKLKSDCMNQMESLNQFNCEIDSESIDDIDTQVYAKIEVLRENYNKLILNNQKTIINSEILIDLKEKFYKMKKVLCEEGEGECDGERDNEGACYSKGYPSAFDKDKHKYEPIIANMNSNSNLNTAIGYKKKKVINKNNTNNNNTYNKQIVQNSCNSAHYSEYSINGNYTSPIIKEKHLVQKNRTSCTTQCNSIERNRTKSTNRPHSITNANLNTIATTNANANEANYDTRSSQLIQMKTEMMILKEDMKRILDNQQDNRSKENEEEILRLTDENLQMKNDLFGLRKEVNELKEIISSMNNKMNNLLEDNQSIKRHNQSLINYISTSTSNQPKPELINYNSNSNCNSNPNSNHNYSPNSPYHIYNNNNNNNIAKYQPMMINNRGGNIMEEQSKEYISDCNEGEMSQ